MVIVFRQKRFLYGKYMKDGYNVVDSNLFNYKYYGQNSKYGDKINVLVLSLITISFP